MGRYDDLEKLDALRRSGALSEEEFQREKARLLDGSAAPAAAGLTVVDRPWGVETNTFLMLMHLSRFSGFVVPGA